jgi:alkylation response protein AidB-like acyl-CoA dehydrogenase
VPVGHDDPEEEQHVDISFGPEYDEYRDQVRAFLDANWGDSPDLAEGEDLTLTPRFKEFAAKAIEAGYYCAFLPKQYGGAEQPFDPIRQLIIGQQFRAVGLPPRPPGLGPNLLVPTLLNHGQEWQKEQFIPPAMSGEHVWCQGFSEPNAGSDLASLRTRAVLEGDEWVINGQKIWTSLAEEATHMFCLCRTDPEAGKHAGISYLMFEMDQPGIQVKPLRQITGAAEFNEVFFTDARAPKDWIVGEPGGGWGVAKTTLLYERASVGGGEGILPIVHAALVESARQTERGGRPAIEDPEIRRRLARIEAWVIAQEYSEYRLLERLGKGKDPGLSFLAAKLIGTDVLHEMAGLRQELAGDDALLEPLQITFGTAPQAPGEWNTLFIGSLGFAIAAGTSNIQRNVIAERGLGLPRDLARQVAK